MGSTFSRCRHAAGLEYSPWYDAGRRLYTAFAICPACNHTEQIQEGITV
jgi:hypothetical protein